DQLALAVGVADRREHEEELVELEVLDAAFDRDLGAALRDHLDVAFAPPGAVDPHDARLEAGLEDDLVGTFELCFLGHESIFLRTKIHTRTLPRSAPVSWRTSRNRRLIAVDSKCLRRRYRRALRAAGNDMFTMFPRPAPRRRQARASPRRGRSCRRR